MNRRWRIRCRTHAAAIILLGCRLLAGAAAPNASNAKPDTDAAIYDQQIRPFLDSHCVECHSGKKPKGDLRLDELAPDFADKTNLDHWLDVLDKVSSGEMPPKKKPRPTDAEIKTLANWMHGQAEQAVAARRAAEGRVVLRRLNRTEYQNTIHDLLHVDVDLMELLPLDSSGSGFDNVGDALHTSSFLMDKYLEAADTALNEAIANGPRPKSKLTRYSLRTQLPVHSNPEKVFRIDKDTVVAFSSSKWDQVYISDFWPEQRAKYRFRVSASSVQSGGKPVTFRVWAGSGGMGGSPGHLVGYFDAPADEPKVFEFDEHVEPHTRFDILPYGLAGAMTVSKVGADKWEGPGLAIQWVEIEGPVNDTWPPESHRSIFGDMPQGKFPDYNHSDRLEVISSQPHEDATRIISGFARRAFRREVSDAEIKPYVDLVDAKLAQKRTFEQAVRAGLLAILVSPDFLFFKETPAGPAALNASGNGPALDDFALANRLSYFLWSTMPDEQLHSLAASHRLSEGATLHKEVDRLLDDPRSARFTENFVGQWLGLRDIGATDPSEILYPEFDDMLKVSMVRETELFFDEVLKNNLSLTNFISSDFSMLNGRLGRHYGISGIDGFEFHKVKLPDGCHRGGLLTMASVLKVTANGTSTSPVLRGAWVLDRLLGTPPPRPPADVPAIEPDTRGATTIREQLAKHRQVETCAACHAKIDPPGFALESFDVIGGYREFYRSSGSGKDVIINGQRMIYRVGKPVDPSDVLPDGRKFANIDELKQLLLGQKEQVARALTIRLLTYATGGPPEPADKERVEAIVKRVEGENYGLRSLIHDIVDSDLFRLK